MPVWRAWAVTGLWLAIGTSTVLAQSGPDGAAAAAQRAEMKKLDWLAGRWKGEGWIQMGPQRQEFAGTETVQRKVGGLALLVEGNFKAKGAPADAPPIHETVGVASYDKDAGHYWFNAWLASGRSGKYEARLESDHVLQWFIPIPQGQIRYTIRLDDRKRWSEVGELSPDGGTTWRKFFEMTLTKLPE
jgi:hypothetical protein